MVGLALSLRLRITPTLAPVYMAGSGLVLVLVGLHAVDHHVADRAMAPKLILSIRHLDRTYRHTASQQTGSLDVAATRTSWLSPSHPTNKDSEFFEQCHSQFAQPELTIHDIPALEPIYPPLPPRKLTKLEETLGTLAMIGGLLVIVSSRAGSIS